MRIAIQSTFGLNKTRAPVRSERKFRFAFEDTQYWSRIHRKQQIFRVIYTFGKDFLDSDFAPMPWRGICVQLLHALLVELHRLDPSYHHAF